LLHARRQSAAARSSASPALPRASGTGECSRTGGALQEEEPMPATRYQPVRLQRKAGRKNGWGAAAYRQAASRPAACVTGGRHARRVQRTQGSVVSLLCLF